MCPTIPIMEVTMVQFNATDVMYANAALSGIQLPSLESKIELDNHIRRVNGMLTEMNLLRDDGIVPGYRTRLLTMIGQSLTSVKEVHLSFVELERRGHGWKEIQSELLRQFCSRSELRRELAEKLNRLQFKKPFTSFMSQVKEVYYLHIRFYEDKSELRSLVRTVMHKVPTYISRQLLKEMMSKSDDWEVSVPFTAFLERLEKALHFASECEDLGYTNSRYGSSRFVDKVAAVGERKSAWLEDWCAKFDHVLYCYGAGHRDELLKLAKENDSIEVKTFDRSKRGPYALIGCKTIESPKLECYSRPFILKPKNL